MCCFWVPSILILNVRIWIRLHENHFHDDVIKWKHFPRYWPFVREISRSPVNYPHKRQWLGALKFSLICAWINGSVNNGEAGDLRRHRSQCDVIVMLGGYLGHAHLSFIRITARKCKVPSNSQNVHRVQNSCKFMPCTERQSGFLFEFVIYTCVVLHFPSHSACYTSMYTKIMQIWW